MLKHEFNVAVFIDCENVNPQITTYALQIAAQFGRITIRRGYGNGQTLAGKWQNILVNEAFIPCLHYQNNESKNSADIDLAIDALEVMFDRKADIFCIVTNDSDFSSLCRKLRERGSKVYVIGEQKSSRMLRNCSDMFFEFVPRFLPNPAIKYAGQTTARNTVKDNNPPNAMQKNNGANAIPLPQAFAYIKDVVQQALQESGEPSIYLGLLAQKISLNYPNLKPSNYGFDTWSKMLKSCPDLILEFDNKSSYYVSLKKDITAQSKNLTEQTQEQEVPNQEQIQAEQELSNQDQIEQDIEQGMFEQEALEQYAIDDFAETNNDENIDFTAIENKAISQTNTDGNNGENQT